MREKEYRTTWLTLSDRVKDVTDNVCVKRVTSEEEYL